MLTLGDIIRASKENVTIGPWKTGKIPASAFPIAKQKRLPGGSAWSWRVVDFYAHGHHCRVLIRLNHEVSYYSAILSVENGGHNHVVCHHEMHLSHRNWHCHFIRGDVLQSLPGVLRDWERMRVYEAEPSRAGAVAFDVELDSALQVAATRYRFPAPPEKPAQGSFPL